MMTPEQAAAFVFAQASLTNAEVAALEANDRCNPERPYDECAYSAIFRDYDRVIGRAATITLFAEANERRGL